MTTEEIIEAYEKDVGTLRQALLRGRTAEEYIEIAAAKWQVCKPALAVAAKQEEKSHD